MSYRNLDRFDGADPAYRAEELKTHSCLVCGEDLCDECDMHTKDGYLWQGQQGITISEAHYIAEEDIDWCDHC